MSIDPLNINFPPISKIKYIAASAKSISISFLKFVLRRRKRTVEQVDKDYNNGTWKRILNEKSWKKYSTLRDDLETQNETRKILCLMEAQAFEVPMNIYYKYRIKKLQSIVNEMRQVSDTLIELGCAYGQSSFSLSLDGVWPRIIGFDLSTNALLAATEKRDFFGVKNVEFHQLDLTDPTSVQWEKFEGNCVFSYFCLEQLPNSIPIVIENIIKAKPKRVMNLETSWDLLQLNSLVDIATGLHVLDMNYQRSLLKELRRLEAEGKVKIHRVEKIVFSPRLRNFPTLIDWSPIQP